MGSLHGHPRPSQRYHWLLQAAIPALGRQQRGTWTPWASVSSPACWTHAALAHRSCRGAARPGSRCYAWTSPSPRTSRASCSTSRPTPMAQVGAHGIPIRPLPLCPIHGCIVETPYSSPGPPLVSPSMDESWEPHTTPQDLHLCSHPLMHHGNPIQTPKIPTCIPIRGCIVETSYCPPRTSHLCLHPWMHPYGPPSWLQPCQRVCPDGWGSSWGPLSTVLPPVSPLVSPSMVTSQELHTTPGPPIHGCILGTPYNQPVQVLHLCPNSGIPRNGPPPWPCQRVCLNTPYIGLPWMGEPSKPPSTVLSHFSEQPLSHRSLGLGEQRRLQ